MFFKSNGRNETTLYKTQFKIEDYDISRNILQEEMDGSFDEIDIFREEAEEEDSN